MLTYFEKSQLIILLTISFISSHFTLFAQDKKLTFSQVYIFGEPKIFNPLPQVQGWIDDEHYLIQKRDVQINSLVKVNAQSGEETIVIDYSAINLNLKEAGLSAEQKIGTTSDYTGLLFKKDDDLYFYSIIKNELKRLTENKDEEANPMLSPDGKKVAFTRNRDLYVLNLETGKETRLTNDASDVIYNGYASWVYMEEIIGRSLKYLAFWWAPNSEMIAFLNFDDSPVPKFPLYKTDEVHAEIEWQHYPKSGDPNPKVKLGVAHLSENKIVWVDEDESVDQYTAWPFWSPDCKELFYQVLNRGQDHLQILSANPANGENRLVYTEKQSTWVRFFKDIYILKNRRGFILRSDVDGWCHLYFYNMNGILEEQLTKGEWNVSEIVLVDEENNRAYFEGNKKQMLETHLFVIGFNGKDLKQLTTNPGTHNALVSPTGKYFCSDYSNIDTPQILDLYDGNGNLIRNLGDRKTKDFCEYSFGKTDLFMIETPDGLQLPAAWVLPPNFDKNKKYPVLFSIYGGPGTIRVLNSFLLNLDRYFIAQSGIISFVVDHRGSAYFGGKGKSYVHRNLGKWEIEDYSTAVEWLKKKPFVDSTKIGITGGSYGGYVTCMALTLGADYFTHGIAEYSVTDWRLYDNVYTERYMDTPEENPDGYKFGSAMTHADKYKGLLRIVHGMLDDNVHMQNTIQLVDKLTSLDKKFELMLYPNEKHGVSLAKRRHEQREYVEFWFKNFLNKDFIVK
jgi:dipeptidyl-peptidase-4